ncbi:alpha/beta fold hydrolase [Escherichia coli]|nr:alpha/beta fold hydrolase [Escherichia coli]
MLRIKPLFILCAALLTVTPAASADVNSDMNQFFNKLGFASNTTQPGVWQGQAAGYAYGGSLYARTQVKNVQLISMTLPDINAGCGGIDAYLGSFSFINGEQLQRFVKQIMSNAAGYFFDLALQTTVPEIKTAKDFLQKMASDINSMNLSSCQAAQGIIGGLFPRTQVSQQKVCQDIAGESNIFADWAASRQGCTVGGKSDSVRDKASDKDKERVTKNINIMWNALSKNRMFDGNKELKEFVMTLTGSLVFGPNGEITPLSARTTDRSIIRAMMEGGTAKIYHCNDSDKCLKVVADTPVTISRDNALKSQITKLLASIQNKAVSDTPLDDKEKGFISSTTIPVFKYLVVRNVLLPSFANAFTEAGFATITFDYRGFGESEGERGRLVPAMQTEDIISVINWAEKQVCIDNQRIGLWGTSLGGCHVFNAAAQDKRVKSIVSQLAFADGEVLVTGEMNELEKASFLSTLNKMAEKKKNTGKEMFVGVTRVLSDNESKVFFEKVKGQYPEMDIKIPFLTVMETLQYKPAESAAKVQCPVLVVIAGQDSVNPPEQGRALYDAVASGTKELYEEADACHYDIYEGAFFERVAAVQTQWFKKHL